MSFSYKTNASIHLSQWGERVYGAQSWKERTLLCESVFIPIDRRTFILKMVRKVVFLMKSKCQYHLSQWGECVFGTQSWNESRLLCESMFVQIDMRALIWMKPKHQCNLSQ